MKKFSALFICLLMVITCGFAGCAGFSIDKVKYYNEILASVGNTHITRYELLSAYNNYGQSYYVSQLGQSEEEALESTLNLLIDRESLYQYALDNNSKYKPTAYQVNSIINDMFESLDSQMDSYIDSAKTILNIEKSENPDSEEKTDETAYLYENYKYSPRAKVVPSTTVFYTDATKTVESETETEFFTTEYKIQYIIEDEPTSYEKLIRDEFLKDFTKSGAIEEIKTKYLAHFKNDLEIEEKENATVLYNKAISLFAKDLINYEYYLRDDNGKTYSKATEELISRYFKRTFDSQIKSQYLENIRIEFLKSQDLKISELIDEYKFLSAVSYQQYNYDIDGYKTDIKDIGTKGDTILYHPTLEDGTQFGYFIHTLINFSDVQKNQISALDKVIGETDIEYKNIISQTTAKARNPETGLVEDDAVEVSLADIISEYNTIKNLSNYNERMAKFIEFMFKYTGDTATLSSGMPYVVGNNGNSAMEQAFTDESVKLMETGINGSMSDIDINNIDSMCITSYGIHLVFYVGNVNSFDINYSDVQLAYIQSMNKEFDATGKLNLYYKEINPLTHETYFDMLFDAVYPANSDENYTSNNGYSEYEKDLVKVSQNSHKVTKFTTKIKATKTKI